MGIKNLKNIFIKENVIKVYDNLDKINGWIGIDFNNFYYRFKFSSKNKENIFKLFLKQIIFLITNNCNPIYVFDSIIKNKKKNR